MTETDSIPQDRREDYTTLDEKSENYGNTSGGNEVTYTCKDNIGTDYNYKHQIVWKNAIVFLILHLLAAYGFLLALTGSCQFYSIGWASFLAVFLGQGITVGAHRYYTHRSFKAKPLLRMLFIILQTAAGQNSMFVWCRDHRLHHRFSDTDGDPHNAKRGFFFSHIGWLMSKKHALVFKLGKQIDLSDLQADWMVMFQKKYYYPLYIILSIIIPVAVPVYYFGESWTNSVLICFFLRTVVHLNGTWLVNSFAHLYGTRPYDKNFQPVETWLVSLITQGEGWHNYHHVFPWDYKAAELTTLFNYSAETIRFFEFIGLAWDLKTVSPELVKKRVIRTGDGTHYLFGNEESRSAVTAMGFIHPINPTYRTVMKTPDVDLSPEGVPLFHDEDK